MASKQVMENGERELYFNPGNRAQKLCNVYSECIFYVTQTLEARVLPQASRCRSGLPLFIKK